MFLTALDFLVVSFPALFPPSTPLLGALLREPAGGLRCSLVAAALACSFNTLTVRLACTVRVEYSGLLATVVWRKSRLLMHLCDSEVCCYFEDISFSC